MAFKAKWKKKHNIAVIGKNIISTVIVLFAVGYAINAIGTAFLGYCSPMWNGLNLIGWQMTNGTNYAGTPTIQSGCSTSTQAIVLSGVNGSGILMIFSIIAIIGILTNFIDISF
jgi:hypothetical protein